MKFEWCNRNLTDGCPDYMADHCEMCNIARAFEHGRSLAQECQECNNDEGVVVFDAVQRPSHYADTKIEVIDYIEDKGFGYHLGNAIKYISRAGKKDPTKTVEDLRKAEWYIERYIQLIEGEQA